MNATQGPEGPEGATRQKSCSLKDPWCNAAFGVGKVAEPQRPASTQYKVPRYMQRIEDRVSPATYTPGAGLGLVSVVNQWREGVS
jgi:hypothetical protein